MGKKALTLDLQTGKKRLETIKVATHNFKEWRKNFMRCTESTTLRIDNNLKTRIRLLAIKNNFSMNKMFIYLLELGYRFYVERYEKDYGNKNRKFTNYTKIDNTYLEDENISLKAKGLLTLMLSLSDVWNFNING